MATLSNDANALKSYRRAVKNIVTSHYSRLCSVLVGSMEEFASQAFAARLISWEVMKDKKFSSIYHDFNAGLEFCVSISEVQKRWKTLTHILEDLGGPASIAGRDLNKQLSSLTDEPNPEEVFQEHFDKLSALIGSEAILQRVIDKLFACHLITKSVYDDITTIPSYSSYLKVSKVVCELHEQIKISREPKKTLLKICDVLLSTNDWGLTDIATKIKYDIGEVNETIQYNREDDTNSFDISQEDSIQIEQTNEPNFINDIPVVDQQHFHEALNKSGAVKTRISKAIVQGPARAGKTCVKSLILSQPYKSKVSTGCCESPDIAVGEFAVSRYGQQEDEYHWELVDSEAMIEKFASEIRDLMSQPKKENTVESSHNSKEIEKLPVDDQTTYTADTLDDDLEPLSSSKLSHPAKKNVAAARVGEMDLIHMVNMAQGKHGKLTFHKEWLYFIDCGGQIQFQQLIQAFIPCASVLMLVTSLAENLSNQCSASFECEEDKIYNVSDYLPSIETLLRHLTLMVSSSSLQQELVGGNELSDVIKISKKLKVLIVATHRDLYEERLRNGERMETIDEKEEKLQRIFMHIEDNLVFLNEKIFFEVDGRKASQEVFDDPAIKEIRAELRDQAFKVDIPLSWYAFEILLRKRSSSPKGCGVLSLKDCETIGFSLGLKKEEVQSALKFFHVLNTILYYPGVSDLVFINPHCLIEVIRELVVLVCESRRHVKAGRGTAECRKVVEKGKISKDVLNTISKKCSEISKFFPDHNFSSLLLQIFKHLLIATERPNKKKFFMPALLPLTDPSHFVPSSYFSLLLYFKKGTPLGLFCAMIVNLLMLRVDNSDDFFDDFVWSIDRTSIMFSNLITLQHYNMKGKVVFVESNDCFEVHFRYAEDKEKGEKYIHSTLNDTIKKRKYDSSRIKYKLASFCPCPKKSRHAAILHTSGKVWCSISGNLLIDPDRQSDTASSKVMTTSSTTRLQTSNVDQPLEDTKSPDIDIGEVNETIQYNREDDTNSFVKQRLSRDKIKSHEPMRISTDEVSGQFLPVDESKSHEQIKVSTDGVSGQSLPSHESQSHDPKRISTDGTSGQSLSSDEQASLDQVIEILLDQQPGLKELITHARTAQWNLLGVQLELDSVSLAGCTDFTSTYQLWIQEKAEMATRRNLLSALRSIRENNVARKYENYLRTLVAENGGTLETIKDVTNLVSNGDTSTPPIPVNRSILPPNVEEVEIEIENPMRQRGQQKISETIVNGKEKRQENKCCGIL